MRVENLKRVVVLFISVITSIQTLGSPENKGNWSDFENNRSILGLSVGLASMEEVFSRMGEAKPIARAKKHELARICYVNQDSSVFAVLVTGFLHDYSTLYGFELSNEVDAAMKKSCIASARLGDIASVSDGISLFSRKSKVLERLGKPTKEINNSLLWKYEYYQKYDKPRVNQLGPKGAKRTVKGIGVGAWHHASIEANFRDGKITRIRVFDMIEGDTRYESVR